VSGVRVAERVKDVADPVPCLGIVGAVAKDTPQQLFCNRGTGILVFVARSRDRTARRELINRRHRGGGPHRILIERGVSAVNTCSSPAFSRHRIKYSPGSSLSPSMMYVARALPLIRYRLARQVSTGRTRRIADCGREPSARRNGKLNDNRS
jgi:hypothetical protein